MSVKNGDKVKVEYTGTLEDGTVFDSTEKQGDPLEFEIGAGMIIKGFEETVVGMQKGEEKEVKLEPAKAYGDLNPDLKKLVPLEHMPKDKEIKPGMMIALQVPNGPQIPVRIVDVDDKNVTIDLNHPLAGKILNFKIKVIDIEPKAS